MLSPTLRLASPADFPEIRAIYGHHVLTGTASFEEEPPSLEEIAARHARLSARGWPWLVATDGTGVLGYAYCTQIRERTAYRFCAEDSIYVRPDAMGRGIGRALLAALLKEAQAWGFTQMVAVIGDSANTGSIVLHERAGFRYVGTLKAVGFKFGRWLDTVYMQKGLGPSGQTI